MLALVIGKYGSLPVEIFEAGPTVTTIGAGVGFFGRTMDILKELGLYDEFVKIASGPPQENTGLFIFARVLASTSFTTVFKFRSDF